MKKGLDNLLPAWRSLGFKSSEEFEHARSLEQNNIKWDSQFDGFSESPKCEMEYFVRSGYCFLDIKRIKNGTSNSTKFSFTVPFNSAEDFAIASAMINNGIIITCLVEIAKGSNLATVTPWDIQYNKQTTSSGGKALAGQVIKYKVTIE